MKKTIFIISIIGLMSLIGCEDKLYLDPHQSISSSQAFETIDDFYYAVNGMYAAVRGEGGATDPTDTYLYGGNLMIYPDIMADNLTRSIEGRLTHTNLYNWALSSDYYMIEEVFDQAYIVILRANKVIEAAAEFSPADDEATDLNNYKAQALAMRALMHLELVKMFGKAYSQATSSDLGVPYITSTDATYPGRDGLTEVYDKIVTDLNAAYGLVDPASTRKDRLSKPAIAALQAKVAMEMSNYDLVISKAKEALAAVPVSTRVNFSGIWKDENKDGVLFYIGVEKKDDCTLGTNFSQSSSAGIKSEYVCSYELYQLYDPTDIRLASYITTSAYEGNTYNHIEKYRGRSSSVESNPSPDLVDLKILRAADMSLLVAEANMIKTSPNPTEALEYLDDVRDNRYTAASFPPLSNVELLDEIYLQRRLELAFEGDRLFVLKRRGLDVQRTADGQYFDGTGVGPENLILSASSYKWQLPLPQSELDVNPTMKDQQNPGY